MQRLTTELLSRACRTFMDLSYPDGKASIPDKKQPYYAMPVSAPLCNFVPPAALASGIAQIIGEEGTTDGYAFRLGSSCYPNLKLRVQEKDHAGATVCVFMVDTHDAFSKESRLPPPNDPDAAKWLALQENNRVLKEKIEVAWAAQGLATVNSLLREDLQ